MSSPLPSAPPLSPRALRAHDLIRTLGADADLSALDDLLERTRRSVGAGWAHFSLLTDRQVTAAACGPVGMLVAPGTEFAFDDTICATVLRTGETVTIPDTHRDARISSIPAVREGMVGAYHGVPVRVDSLLVGVLCVVDAQAREWSEQDVAVLDAAGIELHDCILRLLSAQA